MIYVASKASHRPMWREMRKRYPIEARWIDVDDSYIGRELTDDEYRGLWVTCIEDVSTSGAVVAWYEAGEVWKGALIEIGVALALGKPVFLAGALPDHSWVHHPLVEHVGDLPTALHIAAQTHMWNWQIPIVLLCGSCDGKAAPEADTSGRLIFREVKTAKGPFQPGQEEWLARLAAGGHDAKVWRPADLTEARQVLLGAGHG